MTNKEVHDRDGLVSLDWIAERWSVSRPTARRILERAGAKPLFLSGAPRGVRRYHKRDVIRVERESEAP